MSGEARPKRVVFLQYNSADADVVFSRALVAELKRICALIDMAVDPVREMFSSRTQQQRPFKTENLSARGQAMYIRYAVRAGLATGGVSRWRLRLRGRLDYAGWSCGGRVAEGRRLGQFGNCRAGLRIFHGLVLLRYTAPFSS